MAQTNKMWTPDMEAARAAAIAKANDAFRASIAAGGPRDGQGHAVVTARVNDMGPEFLAVAMLTVAGFADFTEDNDPFGEHDMAVVDVCGAKVMWKIDLYDLDYEYLTADPLDPAQTRRVLTICFPEER
jgi:hypothetical protein